MRGLTLREFNDLVEEIEKNHAFRDARGWQVKYIRPHYDTRTRWFYGISFQTLYGDVDFFIVNENRGRQLGPWIREWLAEKPKVIPKRAS